MEQHQGKKGDRRIALVHDFLVSFGGAERVLAALHELYPEAPIYTLLADPAVTERVVPGATIRTSWLQKLPGFLRRRYRLLLPFFPVAVETFDLREYDVILSSSGAWSKGVVTRLHTWHIAYLHSPMRYAWDYHEAYLREARPSGLFRFLVRLFMSYLRVWDVQAADRPDILLSNSFFTAERVRKYYRRESEVIYPPALDLAERFPDISASDAGKREHFLMVARLTASKKADVVIDAANKLGVPLVVVGSGPEAKHLRKAAGKTVRFAGKADDAALAALYQKARALILPSEEDFGMVAVEALSFGVPVIAYDYGGIREIIEDKKTGLFVESQTPEVFAAALARFIASESSFDRTLVRRAAERFSKQAFQEKIKAVLALENNSAG
ncbi:MAG: hypothetical protein A2808_01400 [Candidatus Moranbacteria bacterium RIFCSPHIGHO2_01_FULL_55_24]|nr:MAG: hypothetical protein A2808_01400 [Candidatus Moranbacteria bacterium RIFCSPHIGHO2_01_FULL_55_24]